MTLVEALRESRNSGRIYHRRDNTGWSGWLKWSKDSRYSGLSAEDILADDWIEVKQRISSGVFERVDFEEELPTRPVLIGDRRD